MISITLKKEDTHKIIDQLPPNSTWDYLMHKIFVVNAIEQGISDGKALKIKDVEDVRKKYSLPG
jgi:hypothetical protein